MASKLQFTDSLWDEFQRVDSTDARAVRAFCERWRFHLPTKNPQHPYISVDTPQGRRSFRRWHQDFTRNVLPAGFDYEALILRIAEEGGEEAPADLLQDGRDAADALTAASLDYLPHVSIFVAAPQQGIPRMTVLYAARDTEGGPHVRPFDEETIVGVAGKIELTLTSVGHVFMSFLDDILRGISGNLPFLLCANCGKWFLPTPAQLGHLRRKKRRKDKVYCRVCQAPRDQYTDAALYRRAYMREYMRRRRAEEEQQ